MARVSPVSALVPTRPEPFPVRVRLGPRLKGIYNVVIWMLLTVLLFAQFFAVIWTSVSETNTISFGRDPAQGKYSIPGYNDEPYSDRAVACMRRSKSIRPVQLAKLLQQQQNNHTAVFQDGINGYRVVSRESFSMDAAAIAFYVRQCNALSLTLDAVLSVCQTLGYNVTGDFLRIVNGLNGDDVVLLPSALPVLIIPFIDKGPAARYVVPGHDGAACVLRAQAMFETEATTSATVSGVPRAVRESKTVEMLKYPGGEWRNGWYEDPVVGMRWYSDVISSLPTSRFGIGWRQFEVLGGVRELDCSKPPYGCGAGSTLWRWSETLSQLSNVHSYDSITISNGSRYGLFLFEIDRTKVTTSQYSLEKLLSNTSLALLLSRWLVAMIALWPLDTIGVGALSNSKSFHTLPLILLPRFKATLEGFWTSGCNFEGNQRALSDAWFEIYPAIGELVFVYFSLLNLLAKALRRRMSDVLFGPTLLFFGLFHYFRLELASTNWFEFDKRIPTVATADELEAASILDFFTTDLALRTNGNIESFFYMKLVVLGVNLLPLLLSRRVRDGLTTTAMEKALVLSFASQGGLGSMNDPYVLLASGEKTERAVRPYEIVRAKYVVVGSASGRVLVSFDHWMWLFATARVRLSTLGIRVLIFEVAVTEKQPLESEHGWDVAAIDALPEMITVADTRLELLATSRISACAIK